MKNILPLWKKKQQTELRELLQREVERLNHQTAGKKHTELLYSRCQQDDERAKVVVQVQEQKKRGGAITHLDKYCSSLIAESAALVRSHSISKCSSRELQEAAAAAAAGGLVYAASRVKDYLSVAYSELPQVRDMLADMLGTQLLTAASELRNGGGRRVNPKLAKIEQPSQEGLKMVLKGIDDEDEEASRRIVRRPAAPATARAMAAAAVRASMELSRLGRDPPLFVSASEVLGWCLLELSKH